jgi:hypothetical protein
MSDIEGIVTEKAATFLALRSVLAESSRVGHRPCCCACGRFDPLESVAPGVFACPDCLAEEEP